MRPVKTHMCRNKRWWVEDANKKLPSKGPVALCVYGSPINHPTLYIPVEGDTLDELDSILHEALHACTELDEDAVEETANAQARLLWRLGWRKKED